MSEEYRKERSSTTIRSECAFRWKRAREIRKANNVLFVYNSVSSMYSLSMQNGHFLQDERWNNNNDDDDDDISTCVQCVWMRQERESE